MGDLQIWDLRHLVPFMCWGEGHSWVVEPMLYMPEIWNATSIFHYPLISSQLRANPNQLSSCHSSASAVCAASCSWGGVCAAEASSSSDNLFSFTLEVHCPYLGKPVRIVPCASCRVLPSPAAALLQLHLHNMTIYHNHRGKGFPQNAKCRIHKNRTWQNKS